MLKRYLFEKIKGKQAYQGFFKFLHDVSLEGLNIGVGGCPGQSGETAVLKILKERASGPMQIFDVGANVGTYADEVLNILGVECHLHCFEPSKVAYQDLKEKYDGQQNFRAYNFGFGDTDATVHLFADEEGSSLGSVFHRRLDHLAIEFQACESIRLKRIDDFCSEAGISHIDLLKLDAEGNELNILKGASRMIEGDSIDLIQFEFGGCNISSRTYFQDFYYFLKPRYNLYRIVMNGLVPIENYDERLEIFLTANYLAIRCELDYMGIDGRMK